MYVEVHKNSSCKVYGVLFSMYFIWQGKTLSHHLLKLVEM